MNTFQTCCRLGFLVVVLQLITVGHGTEIPPFPVGTRQACSNEGQPVKTEFDKIDKINCYPCICKNGYVECRSSCPTVTRCPWVVKDGPCCNVCKGCNYKGIHRPSHTEWTEPADPCKVFRCEAGIITKSEVQCHTPCPKPLPPEPGKCCPTCSVCQINGQTVAEDREVTSEDDPCLKCRCSKGQLTCSKKACPVLQCRDSYQPPDECCPRCLKNRELIVPENQCMIQRIVSSKSRPFKFDECTYCKCENATTAVCTRNTCPILDCEPDLQRTLPGHCCPTCIRLPVYNRAFSTNCTYKDETHQNGDVWKTNNCITCKCHDAKVSCVREICNTTCPHSGMKLIKTQGDCCARCVENDGTCMAFGDPHYKTFDGKIYTFKGIGKYQMVHDCSNNTFSIRVANELMGRRYLDSTITKRVAIRFGKVRLYLQQRLRVKYNGKKIAVPFTGKGLFRVNKVRDNIEVRLQNDVSILWNGRSFLEVTVPPSYKGKLCGLCGNFNGEVQDDLKTKNGDVVTDKELLDFGYSWCIGRQCTTKKPPQANQVTQLKHRGDLTACKYMSNGTFEACESQLSNSKYYKACRKDMYNCVTGKCYCESLLAYSRECERLGVKLSNWQWSSNCDSSSFRRAGNVAAQRNGKKHSRYPAGSLGAKVPLEERPTFPLQVRPPIPIQ